MDIDRKFLYLDELRRYFGIKMANGAVIPVSRDTIERHFKRGLRKAKVGGKVAVFIVDLEAYLDRMRGLGETQG